MLASPKSAQPMSQFDSKGHRAAREPRRSNVSLFVFVFVFFKPPRIVTLFSRILLQEHPILQTNLLLNEERYDCICVSSVYSYDNKKKNFEESIGEIIRRLLQLCIVRMLVT